MTSHPSHPVTIGQVAGVFGIKGWIKIRSETDPPTNILAYSPWWLEHHGQWQAYELVNGQRHNKGLIVQLRGVDDRDLAASLVGARIAIERSQLPELEDGEYYWSDLIGLEVANQQGCRLGRIEDMMQTGVNDVMVIKDGEAERLIPYVKGHFVMKVDLENRLITVDWPEVEDE